jgi:MoaA/NifB/PqqE/SkfB family radical SAM enzyme
MDFKFLETQDVDMSRLRAVEVGITSRCNFRCDYCCAYDLNEKKTLTGAQCISVLEGLPHLQRVKLSGGEVLLRFDDCLEVVKWCASRGIFTQINTNGTLLNRERIATLADAGLNVLHFSLNHTDAESHARFYRVRPAFFETIVTAIQESVRNPKLQTVAETILFEETKDRLVEVHRFLHGLGVRQQEIQMEIPAVHTGYKTTLQPETIAASIVELLENRNEELELSFSCLSAYFRTTDPLWQRISPHLQAKGVRVAHCIEGKSQLHLHSNGDVLICELGNPDVIGNVFERPLADIFASPSEKLKAFLSSKHGQETFTCLRRFSYPHEAKARIEAKAKTS